jgi:sterol desaturase/sphingolipid hydroxylase (fatty acid hydroxylase superfamily)
MQVVAARCHPCGARRATDPKEPRCLSPQETHSGLDLHTTFLGRLGFSHGYSALFHDFHHSNNRGNYGGPANAFWDTLCGTEDPGYSRMLQTRQIPPYHTRWL